MIADSLKSETITADDEARLVELARERVGIADLTVPTAAAMDARERLLAAYMPAITATVRRSKSRSKEDLEAELVIAFLEMVADHDPSRSRLSTRVNAVLNKRAGEYAATEGGLAVPASARDRFYNILFVRSEGSMSRALDEADRHPHFNRHTFLAVARALFFVEAEDFELDAGAPAGLDEIPAIDAERVELVEFLLSKLDPGTRLIIELFYGFTSPALEDIRVAAGYKYDEELSDAQIASLEAAPVHSKRSIIRRRLAALDTMRRALTLGEDQ